MIKICMIVAVMNMLDMKPFKYSKTEEIFDIDTSKIACYK